MGAVTSILVPGNNSELDFVNIFGILGVLIFSSIMFAVYGTQSGNIDLVVLGVIFALMGVAGVLFVEFGAGSFFTSSSTIAEASFSMWVGMLAFNIQTLVAGIRLNAFAPPTQGYAFSALSSQQPSVKGIVNGVWAPGGENLALLGSAAALVMIIYQKTENIFLSIVAGTTPFAVLFASLHGETTPSFWVFAASVMFVMGVYLFGTDLGAELPLAQYIPVTFGLFYGVHRGINISNFGGLGNWYTTILQAPEPLIYVSYLVIILDAVMALFAVLYVADKVYTVRDILG
ncbi:hypothetical protein KY092_08365 [Natronomonas gomsonensis]|uniref:hypothetical protein n=1 Tax=Natronomonas gomsonensis TaxID=1046043 RepID=UPI0020CA636D|nr:hypothetical protein [Natronomonas gomsonensis]MCY4730571.1 hypothetical protein [Natronomonas gomsonensis]